MGRVMVGDVKVGLEGVIRSFSDDELLGQTGRKTLKTHIGGGWNAVKRGKPKEVIWFQNATNKLIRTPGWRHAQNSEFDFLIKSFHLLHHNQEAGTGKRWSLAEETALRAKSLAGEGPCPTMYYLIKPCHSRKKKFTVQSLNRHENTNPRLLIVCSIGRGREALVC